MRTLLVLTVVVLGACKGGNDYSAMARQANAARADAGNPDLMPSPPNATLLAAAQNSPRGLHVVGGNVYWFNYGGRPVGPKGVFSAPINGGKLITIAAGDPDIMASSADMDSMFWLAPREGIIYKAPRAGGAAPQELAPTSGISRGMAIDGTDVFWGQNEGIFRVPKAGGKPATVVEAGIPDWLTVDESHVYWYSTIAGVLYRAPKKGGAAQKVYSNDQNTLHTFFVDGPDLFVSFGEEKKMVIQKLPKSGGKAVNVTEGQMPAADFAVDGSHVYWITEDDIFRVPRNGGEVTKVVAKVEHGKDVAVDGDYVYWADRTRVQRMQIPK